MEGIQMEQIENEKPVLKRKRRNSIEVIPKHMKLVDVRTFNNKITNLMLPYTYGYDGSVKTIKQSKIGNRRISEWSIDNIHASSVNVDVDSTIQKSNVENKAHHDGHDETVDLQSNGKIQSVGCNVGHNVDINITNDSVETNIAANSQPNDRFNSNDVDDTTGLVININPNIGAPPKPANVMYRRRSARLSMSRNELGSFFFEPSDIENEQDSSINHETQDDANKNRSSEKQQENIFNNLVPSVQAETNKRLNIEKPSQNNLRKSAFQLLARSDGDDSVKLWQTKNNSISDPLFYCFDLVEKTNTNTLKVTCLLCESKNEPLTCKVGSNSNLKAHLNRKHKTLYDELKNIYHEQKLTDSMDKNNAKKDEIQDLILKFIIKERLPLQKVESEHLNRLIGFCLNGKKDVSKSKNDESTIRKCFLTRKVASRKIKNLSHQQRSRIKECLKSIKFISATSDVWSRNNRSYIAVSVHYIAPENGVIETKFIACERFFGRHNHEAMAQKLKLIFAKYEISEKVKFITTDGAGEYKCAMVRFGDNYQSLVPLLNSAEDDIIIDNEEDLIEEEEEISEIQAIPAHEYDDTHYEDETDPPFTINEISTENSDFLLPSRVDCSSHLLDKIGKIDSFNAVLDEDYCDIYTKVMGKLNLIWNVTQSRLKLEIFEKYAECKLVKPHRIRWNKIYDAIKCILGINEVKLKAACSTASIPTLDYDDYEFLNEYMNVIRPIAEALKMLEGNRDTFGSYLPTLFGLKFKLDVLKKTDYQFCKPLLQNIVDGFDTRFSGIMDLNNPKSIPLYMAMVSNPSFKLNYLPRNTPMHVLRKIQNMLLKAAEEMVNEEKANSSEENCIDLDTIATNRLGMIFTDKRRKMTDELFENLLLLHMNDWE